MAKNHLGVIGLGVMGRNLALNAASKGFSVAGYEADAAKAEQTANDLYFAKTVQKLYAQYPFLRNLPIDTNKYTIVYDYQKQSLRVRLKKVSRKSVEKEINQTLTGIGVDLEKTAIYYLDQ